MDERARVCGMLAAVGLVLGASAAHAQVYDGRGVPYRQWDVAGTFGLHVESETERPRPDYLFLYDDRDWLWGAGWQVDVGRYWTSHLKTEASFARLTSIDLYGSDAVQVPIGVGSAPWRLDVERSHVNAAATYQFFDNVFAHPYVSVGVRTTISARHKAREPFAFVSDRTSSVRVPIPPVDSRERVIVARPYLAAGYKSYLTERTFIKSELNTSVTRQGPSHWVIRLGFGVDF